jgi:hypothetical protein
MKIIGLAIYVIGNLLAFALSAVMGGMILYSCGLVFNWVMYNTQSNGMNRKQLEMLFGWWLTTFIFALILTFLMMKFEFPIRTRSWFPHGGENGDANLFLMPFLHWGIWASSKFLVVGTIGTSEPKQKNILRPRNKQSADGDVTESK